MSQRFTSHQVVSAISLESSNLEAGKTSAIVGGSTAIGAMCSHNETGKDVSYGTGSLPNAFASTACNSDPRIRNTVNVDDIHDRERMSSINAGAVHELENGLQA